MIFLVMERKAHKFIESIKDKRDGIVLYWQDFFLGWMYSA